MNNRQSSIHNILNATNHYQVLGLSQTATKAEIKAAFKQMALKYHPDKSSHPQAKDVFHKVVNAYEVLSKDKDRQAYDQLARKKAAEADRVKNQQQLRKTQQHYKKMYQQKRKEQSFRQRQSRSQEKQFPRSQSKYQKQKQFNEAKAFFEEYMKKSAFPKGSNEYKAPPKQYASSKTQGFRKYKQPKPKSSSGSLLLMFLILALFWWFMPKISFEPDYMLYSSVKYPHQLKTNRLKVSYFVKPDFVNGTRIPEQKIENYYLIKLQKSCQDALILKGQYEKAAILQVGTLLQRQYLLKAKKVNLKPCRKIIKILKSNPEIKLKKYPNMIGL